MIVAQFDQLSLPNVNHFSKQDHGGGTQTWDIEHLEHGFSFFANNDGVLFYDRISWHLFKTPKKTIIRSLSYDKGKGRLYIGGQGELGYFNLAEYPFRYHDLLPLMDEEQKKDLTDIWEMVIVEGKLIFRSSDRIFTFLDDSFQVYDPGKVTTCIQLIDDKVLYHLKGSGIYALENKQLLSNEPVLKNSQVVEMLDLPGEEHLILTNSNGIFIYDGERYRRWKTNADTLLEDNLIQSAYYWEEKGFVCIGTFLSGLLLFNPDGRLYKMMDRNSGLNNNTINAINVDSFDILWTGSFLDISAIPIDRGNQKIYPDGELQGAIYDIEEWNDAYYFATSNGLYGIQKKDYYDPSDERPFYLIEGSEGECWGLDVVDRQLFIAHNKGAFLMTEQNQLSKLPSSEGVWKFIPLKDQRMAVGTYEGIEVITLGNGGWEYSHKIDSLEVSARILKKTDDETLWLTHPYKGIYKIRSTNGFTTAEIDKVEEQDGIENLNNCYGHIWNGQFLVSNDTCVYAYDQERDSFVRDPQFNTLFDEERLIRILHQQEDAYYISDASAGILEKEVTGSVIKIERDKVIENNKTFIGGFENLKVFQDHFLICTDQGIILRDKDADDSEVQLIIQKLLLEPGDSIHYLYQNKNEGAVIMGNQITGFSIDYAALGKELIMGQVEFSTRMVGFEENWSEWSTQQRRVFPSLWAGVYTFELKARYQGENIGDVVRQDIEIESHFLWSNMAKSIYVFLFLALLFLAVFIPTQKQKKEKKEILQQKRKADSEVQDLKKKNYNIQLEAKNKELASSTMHLLQKNELITDVKDVITEIKNKVKDREAKKELKKLENKLKDDQRLEDDWDNFIIHFNQVHDNFFDRLRKEYPKLTPKDLKLCAYLRLNLSTKEIAPLLGISIRGVEVSRYRLRKKLDLDSEVNLNEFMMSF